MENVQKHSITVECSIDAALEKVWQYWNEPAHIVNWCHASDDWHAPAAENDLRTGGSFKTTMAAKDGSVSFDFGGVYTDIQENSLIAYTMEDGRKVHIVFLLQGNGCKVIETFDAESTNSLELQKEGWQAILNNFKAYTENN